MARYRHTYSAVAKASPPHHGPGPGLASAAKVIATIRQPGGHHKYWRRRRSYPYLFLKRYINAVMNAHNLAMVLTAAAHSSTSDAFLEKRGLKLNIDQRA